MNAKEAAKKAVDETRRLMSLSSGDERETLDEFSEAFEAEFDGWKMRLGELDDEDEEDECDDDEDDYDDDDDEDDDENA